MANCRCWLSVAGEVLMMLKGYMACTGCLPVVSMYSGTQKSGHFWSNFLLMLTVFRWGCSASFLLMTLPWRPDLCRCHWSVKRLTTTPVSAKSPWRFSALKRESWLAFLVIIPAFLWYISLSSWPYILNWGNVPAIFSQPSPAVWEPIIFTFRLLGSCLKEAMAAVLRSGYLWNV